VRPTASDRLILAALALLTVGSVGLKGAVGATVDNPSAASSGQLEFRLARILQAQGFATRLRPYPNRSPAVISTRGPCRLSVRDASEGSSAVAIFAADASGIGPVRYLYQGETRSAPPALAMRLDRLRVELQGKLGIQASAALPLALATSASCGSDNFGLEDLHA
jgi:hypothetical protein